MMSRAAQRSKSVRCVYFRTLWRSVLAGLCFFATFTVQIARAEQAERAEPTEPDGSEDQLENISDETPEVQAQSDESIQADQEGSDAEARTGEPDEPGDQTISSATDEELTAEELAEIEAALAADQEELENIQGSASEGGGEVSEPAENRPRTAVGRVLQSLNPDLSFIADVALAWFSNEDEQLQTGGHDPTSNGFNLQQLELSVSASVDPYFRFDANLVFSLFGVEIEEAYATTLGLPGGLQIRAGQFLTRFGRINPTHPHSWKFVDQSFALGRVFGGEGNRGLGLELSWLTPLPWYVEIVGSATMASGASTNRSFFGGQDLGIDTPLDFLYVVAIKQFFPLSDDWSFFGDFRPHLGRMEPVGTTDPRSMAPISTSNGVP